MTKRQSRPQQWQDACSRASDAINDLLALQEEYQDWFDNLPENLQQSAVAEKLQAVADIDLQGALSTIEEAESADLPLGFGRD